MSTEYVTHQIHAFKSEVANLVQQNKEISHESPFARVRKEIQRQLAQSEKYIVSVLKTVATFANLSPEALNTAAQSMEEVYYKKGETITEQEDIGDAFYLLEEGLISVTRKTNARDPTEIPKELALLTRNAHFGEISLLTTEPRSATLTVLSDTAKCLRMTKWKFDELLSTTNQLLAENRKIIGKDVLDSVPLFKTLTPINKKKLLDAMVPMNYLANSYICRQGTAGNTFFILTEGICKVTINSESDSEMEVAKLRPGDFFGEVALIETSNKRTANVISVEAVTCLTLSRSDFSRLLKNLQLKILEQHHIRSGTSSSNNGHQKIESKNSLLLAKKRRISGYDSHNRVDEIRMAVLLKRFSRFATESLWNSLYSRMYREMFLDPNRVIEYGVHAEEIMTKLIEDRHEAVEAIERQLFRSLEIDIEHRTAADHAFTFGVLRQRNALRDQLCRSWPPHQYFTLCKRLRMIRYKCCRKIIDVDTKGTTAFLILRGSVRIFSKVSADSEGSAKLCYEEDLYPGEIFGESALNGLHMRTITAMAMTNVDLAVIDDQDYMLAQERDAMVMGMEDRSKFLSAIPIFKSWDSYRITRLAQALVQEEVNKGQIVTQHQTTSKDFAIITTGRVDIVKDLNKRYVLTSLHSHDYYGESSIINKYTKHSSQKVQEELYGIAITKLDVLVLHEANFNLIDVSFIEVFRTSFLLKLQWRQNRILQSKHDRAKLRKIKKNLLSHSMGYLPVPAVQGIPTIMSNQSLGVVHKMIEKNTATISSQNMSVSQPDGRLPTPSDAWLQNVVPTLEKSEDPQLAAENSNYSTETALSATQKKILHISSLLPVATRNDPIQLFSMIKTNHASSDHAYIGYYGNATTYKNRPISASPKMQDFGIRRVETRDSLKSSTSNTSEIVINIRSSMPSLSPDPNAMTRSNSSSAINLQNNKIRPQSAIGLRVSLSTPSMGSAIATSIRGTNDVGSHSPYDVSVNSIAMRRPKEEHYKPHLKLPDVEDIPEALNKIFDPIMVVEKTKSPKHVKQIHQAFQYANRPKSARLLDNSAHEKREPGFSATPIDFRPKTSDTLDYLSHKHHQVVDESQMHSHHKTHINKLKNSEISYPPPPISSVKRKLSNKIAELNITQFDSQHGKLLIGSSKIPSQLHRK